MAPDPPERPVDRFPSRRPDPSRHRAVSVRRVARETAKGAAQGAVAGGGVGAVAGAAKATAKAVLHTRKGRLGLMAGVAMLLVPALLFAGILGLGAEALSGLRMQEADTAIGTATQVDQLSSSQLQAFTAPEASTQIPWEIPAAIAYYESGAGVGLGDQPGACSQGSGDPGTAPLGCPPTAGSQPLAGASGTSGVSGTSGTSGTAPSSSTPPAGTTAAFTGRGVTRHHAVLTSFLSRTKTSPTKKSRPTKKPTSTTTTPTSTTTTVPKPKPKPIVYLGPMQIRRSALPRSEWGSATQLPWSADWVDQRISTQLADNLSWSWQYNLADGVVYYSDGSPPAIRTNSLTAQIVASAMTAAISQLPLKGMDSTMATNIFELAQDWFVGWSPGNSSYNAGLGVVCGVAQGSQISVPAPGGSYTTLDSTQLANAAEVVAETKTVGMPTAAAVIAIMTGLTESTLFDLPNASVPGSESFPGVQWGGYSPSNPPNNGTSVGIYQQQDNWGSVAQRMTVSSATAAFLGRTGRPGMPPGLAQITGWQSLPPGEAAQDVQASAYGSRYAAWQAAADKIVGAVEGIPCSSGTTTASGASPQAKKIVAAAEKWLGTPYVWGGGDAQGPTTGLAGTPPPGFDCSGLVLYALAQVGITVPHYSGAGGQWSMVQAAGHYTTNPAKLVPGDLVFFTGSDGTATNPGHVGIVVGPYEMIDAPQTGQTVSFASFAPGTGFGASFVGGGPL